MPVSDSIIPSGDIDKVVSDSSQIDASTPPVVSDSGNVSYENHKRVLGQKKNLQDKFDSLQSEMNTLNESKLVAEGKKDELIDSLQKKAREYEDKYKGAVGTFAYNTISSTFETEASKMGCLDNKVMLLALDADLKSIETNDDFRPESEQVKSALEKLRTEKPYLFQQAAPIVNDGKLVTGDLDPQSGYLNEIAKAKTQKEFDAVRKKYGKD